MEDWSFCVDQDAREKHKHKYLFTHLEVCASFHFSGSSSSLFVGSFPSCLDLGVISCVL